MTAAAKAKSAGNTRRTDAHADGHGDFDAVCYTETNSGLSTSC